MARLEMDHLCDAFAAPVPTPAGGSAAAAVAAIAASLVMMVGRGSPDWGEGNEAESAAAVLRERLLVLGGEDVDAVEAMLAAFRLRAQPGAGGGADVVGAVLRAAEVPLEIARCAAGVAALARDAAENGKRPMRADAEAAATLAASAAQVAASIVDVNLRGLPAGWADEESAAFREAARIALVSADRGSSDSEVACT
ncbi:MAG: cyclodeaminase/cyclohydrolase family protein [Thermoleophilia bacterium]|nr:cyclodeaminase/cyclohydrolase family protein [Thermoleophilia bacterium]